MNASQLANLLKANPMPKVTSAQLSLGHPISGTPKTASHSGTPGTPRTPSTLSKKNKCSSTSITSLSAPSSTKSTAKTLFVPPTKLQPLYAAKVKTENQTSSPSIVSRTEVISVEDSDYENGHWCDITYKEDPTRFSDLDALLREILASEFTSRFQPLQESVGYALSHVVAKVDELLDSMKLLVDHITAKTTAALADEYWESTACDKVKALLVYLPLFSAPVQEIRNLIVQQLIEKPMENLKETEQANAVKFLGDKGSKFLLNLRGRMQKSMKNVLLMNPQYREAEHYEEAISALTRVVVQKVEAIRKKVPEVAISMANKIALQNSFQKFASIQLDNFLDGKQQKKRKRAAVESEEVASSDQDALEAVVSPKRSKPEQEGEFEQEAEFEDGESIFITSQPSQPSQPSQASQASQASQDNQPFTQIDDMYDQEHEELTHQPSPSMAPKATRQSQRPRKAKKK